jgi:hypothetical protein
MRRLLPLLLMLVACLSALSGQEASPTEPLSLGDYIQAIEGARKIALGLKQEPGSVEELLARLPSDSWRVREGGRQFEIPTAGLRRTIEEWQKKNDPAVVDRIVEQLDDLLAGAQSYQNPPSDVQSQHALLNSILARREFHDVHGPTWIDRLKQRLAEFLLRLLGKAFASSTIPAISDILIYGLMLLAVLGVAYWMYRSIREGANLETIMPQPVAVSAKEWPIWLQDARAAGARGDWREAVHLAYWAGISFLEAQGAWRADRARTPREYLRLLPAESERQPALRALTNKLELVWYRMGDADPEIFQQTIVELEKLGCPCQ